VLHAGDISTPEAFAELEALGRPVLAVCGNVDVAPLHATLPARRVVDAGGRRIGMIHDAGPARGRLERLRRAFPDTDAVVFGHSHIPLHEEAPDGFAIFNPGSPTQRRRQAHHTMGLATAGPDGVAFELVRI
jgi:uncharacterized protein